ncbi:MAG: oxidative damage protection protein [Moraxella osloensis]|nr:oxidative damage protection protein [Moraxella osloensis]
MSRRVYCVKLAKEADGLDFAPFPGPMGEKIFNNISKEAWQQWLAHQTLLINEYRLSALDKKAQTFLREELEKFLFGDEEVEKPADFQPR